MIFSFIPAILWFCVIVPLLFVRRYNRKHRPDYAKIALLETEIFGSTDIKIKKTKPLYGYGYNGPPPSSLAKANFPKRIQPEKTVTYPEFGFDPSDTSGITSEDW